jgi:hypothetical protein
MLSDDELRAMGDADRDELLRRLVKVGGDLSLVQGRAQRERFVAVTAVSAIFLVGWILYLAATLPRTYTTSHWRLTWIGFDCALAATLAATAVLALWRQQLVILTAVIAGSLLLCDAWFDATTASGADRWLSFLSIPVEAGLSVVLLATAWLLVRHESTPEQAASTSRRSPLHPLPGVRAGGWKSTVKALRGDGPTMPESDPTRAFTHRSP